MNNKFTLDPLPFDLEAFNSVLSAESFKFHYEAHHASYVNNLNLLLSDNNEKTLEEIIIASHLNRQHKIFNNAAQHWNHSFFWNSISPFAKEIPSCLVILLEKSFGSIDKFKQELYEKGTALFGSGWIWLVFNEKTELLEIIQTANADNPLLMPDMRAVLVIDVWEHAYYIDYRNKRVDYLAKIMELLNWEHANALL